MRRLIINADDFGLTGGVNRAIVECHRAGSVTSATLMAASQAFTEAVDFARATPSLAVGCHVVLVDAAPLLPPSQVPSLLAPHNQRFRQSASDFARAAVRGQLSAKEISAEAAAQFEKLRASGVPITHFDTHKHTHIFPIALQPLLQVARDFGIRAVRNPFAPLHLIDAAAIARQPRLWLRYLQMKMLDRYASGFAREVARSGLRTPDGAFGILATGSLDARVFSAILDAVPDGTWEFVCHPGYNDSALKGVQTRLRESRVTEREVLTAPGLQEQFRRRGIDLISYADI